MQGLGDRITILHFQTIEKNVHSFTEYSDSLNVWFKTMSKKRLESMKQQMWLVHKEVLLTEQCGVGNLLRWQKKIAFYGISNFKQ